MPVFNFRLYDADPFFILSQTAGDIATWTGPGVATGTATVTDNGTGTASQVFVDDTETATADVTVGGFSATGAGVQAEETWLVRDTISGEEITVTTFNVNGGSAYFTISSSPLVAGRAYQTIQFDATPSEAEGTAFEYADYNDGTVLGTAGDDIIDRDYDGDPNGDRVDSNDLYTSETTAETFTWATFGDNANLGGPAGGSQTNGDVLVTFTADAPAGSTFIANFDNGAAANDTIYVPPGSNFSSTSSSRFFANGTATDTILTIDFDSADPGTSTEVHNVQFLMTDIDGITNAANNFLDIITVRAYDVDGNEIELTIDVLGDDVLSADGRTVTANPTLDNPGDQDGAILVTIPGPVERVVITYDNGGDTQQAVFISDINYDAISTQGNADSIDAGAGNDSVFAGSDNDTVTGGTGNDTLDGGSGDDILRGNAGNDSLLGASGDDTLFGGGNRDVLNGGEGNDSLSGGAGADTLDGGIGDDVLSGGGGNDVLVGASGNDTLRGDAGRDSLTFTGDSSTLDGGTGADTIRAEGTSNLVSGGDGADLISGGFGTETVDAGTGDDTIQSSGGADVLSGGGDRDTFEMVDGFGADTLTGGETGTDFDIITFESMAAAVTVTFTGTEAGSATDGTDTLQFTEIEQFILTDFDDLLIGAGGNENVLAGAGNDTLDGGEGADVLSGGDDADTFLVTGAFGNDTIVGGEGGDDSDTIDLSGLSGPVTVIYSGDEAGTITDGVSTITFSNIERLILTDFDDVVDATADGAGINVLAGAGTDSIVGGTGADTVDGGAGDDTISGGAGSDSLAGGGGSDALFVGSGDVATGGDGDDIFFVDPANAGGGTIVVTGGEGSETGGDTVDLNGLWDRGGITFDNSSRGGSATLNDGTAVDFEEMEAVICFVAGTRIATPCGARRVEDLSVGDLVLTRDAGPQPLQWVGRRHGLVRRDMAPVVFQPGTLGNESVLRVSPNHRMLITGWRAQLMFGEDEVLVPAKALIDGCGIRAERPGLVAYHHLLTPEHQVIYAEGAAAETFLPAAEGLCGIDAADRARLFEVRPDLRADLNVYGPTARSAPRARLAHLLAG